MNGWLGITFGAELDGASAPNDFGAVPKWP